MLRRREDEACRGHPAAGNPPAANPPGVTNSTAQADPNTIDVEAKTKS